MQYTLHIKNMVCPRCIKAVTDELEHLQQPLVEVRLGEAVLEREPTPQQLQTIRQQLHQAGFELLEDRKSELVERVKLAIIELISSGKVEELHANVSDYLSQTLQTDYNYLSTLFSSEEGTTIARYVVLQKVERAKELLAYKELSLSQIAYTLGYSSIGHLSNQFKQVTGITPSAFKKQATISRKFLDQVI